MCKLCLHPAYNASGKDPTRTITLRANYSKGWKLKLAAGAAVVADSSTLAAFNSYLLPDTALESYIQDTLALQFNEGWEDTYIKAAVIGAYVQGSMRAASSLTQDQVLDAPGFNQSLERALPPAQDSTLKSIKRSAELITAGAVAAREALQTAEQAERLAGVKSEVNRVAQKGIPPAEAASAAATLVVATHAESILDYYNSVGIRSVVGEIELALPGVEFTTAGDDRVCPDCESLAGQRFLLEEARGIIPVHVGCRCSWWPAIVKI
jgi:hypothetical protein